MRGELNVRSAGAGSRLAHKPETRDEKTVGNKQASLIQSIFKLGEKSLRSRLKTSLLRNNFMLVYCLKVKTKDKLNIYSAQVGSGLAHKHETRNIITLSNKQASLVHSRGKQGCKKLTLLDQIVNVTKLF